MSKLEDKTVEVMDKAMVGVEKLTEKLSEMAVQYGPDVVNAGTEVARITAAGNILMGIGWATLTFVCLKTTKWCYTQAKKWNDEEDGHPIAITNGIGGVLMFIGGMASLIKALDAFFSIWNWVGIFEPKLWIAHRILEKAL